MVCFRETSLGNNIQYKPNNRVRDEREGETRRKGDRCPPQTVGVYRHTPVGKGTERGKETEEDSPGTRATGRTISQTKRRNRQEGDRVTKLPYSSLQGNFQAAPLLFFYKLILEVRTNCTCNLINKLFVIANLYLIYRDRFLTYKLYYSPWA